MSNHVKNVPVLELTSRSVCHPVVTVVKISKLETVEKKFYIHEMSPEVAE